MLSGRKQSIGREYDFASLGGSGGDGEDVGRVEWRKVIQKKLIEEKVGFRQLICFFTVLECRMCVVHNVCIYGVLRDF